MPQQSLPAPTVTAADRMLMTIVTALIATTILGALTAAYAGTWFILFEAGREPGGSGLLAVQAVYVSITAFIGIFAAPVVASGLRYLARR